MHLISNFYFMYWHYGFWKQMPTVRSSWCPHLEVVMSVPRVLHEAMCFGDIIWPWGSDEMNRESWEARPGAGAPLLCVMLVWLQCGSLRQGPRPLCVAGNCTRLRVGWEWVGAIFVLSSHSLCAPPPPLRRQDANQWRTNKESLRLSSWGQ